ncbi:MAG TPA: septal ring lytic transglycosylase RlpA family protein [Anaeromyxobacter sp.]|nr:septal ring lytic transglycosylase RlpA family protein [Anaeromyxobacter sp.]
MSRTVWARVGAAALLVAAACAHGPREPAERREPPPEERRPPGARAEVGIASYYGESFDGRRTASGARYDPRALTCAHPSAPFGTRLKVTDLESGRSVVVTVNDRGPFAPGRVVDLSLAAARALRMLERGLARVRVERVAR